MSTYYYFGCRKCKKKGGFFSHQAWGWGNADIIESFQFLMKHAECFDDKNLCSSIIVFNEYIADYFEYDDPDVDEYHKYKRETEEELCDYFPCSSEWQPEKFKEKTDKIEELKKEKEKNDESLN